MPAGQYAHTLARVPSRYCLDMPLGQEAGEKAGAVTFIPPKAPEYTVKVYVQLLGEGSKTCSVSKQAISGVASDQGRKGQGRCGRML